MSERRKVTLQVSVKSHIRKSSISKDIEEELRAEDASIKVVTAIIHIFLENSNKCLVMQHLISKKIRACWAIGIVLGIIEVTVEGFANMFC